MKIPVKDMSRLQKAEDGDIIYVARIDSPHGRMMVSANDYDGHYMVHVDNVDLEFYFHTTEDILSMKEEDITWEYLLGLYTAEFEAFIGVQRS